MTAIHRGGSSAVDSDPHGIRVAGHYATFLGLEYFAPESAVRRTRCAARRHMTIDLLDAPQSSRRCSRPVRAVTTSGAEGEAWLSGEYLP